MTLPSDPPAGTTGDPAGEVEVEVAAAKSFGKPVFDPKTGQGFGCAGCHVIDRK
jgi:hypothetical protein